MAQSSEHGDLLVLRGIDDILAVRDEWDAACHSRDADIDMFLHVVQSETRDGRPHALLLRRPGRPSSLVAARWERMRVEARIGPLSLPTPALRVITVIGGGVDPDMTKDEAAIVLKTLRAALNTGEADAIRLHYTPITHPLYEAIEQYPSAVMRDRAAVSMPLRHRAVAAPPNFMASVSRNERSNQRRRERALETKYPDAVELVPMHGVADLPRLLEEAETVAVTSYQRRIGVGFDLTPPVQARMKLMAEKGWLRAWVLRLGGKPAAYWIGAVKGDLFVSDYLAFDPAYTAFSPGTYMLMKVLEWMQDTPSGVRMVSFGAGEGAYKERFGTSVIDVATLYLFSARPLPVMANLSRTIAGTAARKLRSMLENSGKLAAARRFFRRQKRVQAE